MPSVFGARRRLTTSATATTYGHWAGCSHNPRWDERLDALPFLTCHALSLAEAVTGGEPRIVRSSRPRCRFFLVAQVCPTAIPIRTRHLRGLLRRSCSGDRRCTGQRTKRRTRRLPFERELFYDFLTNGACTSKSTCGRTFPSSATSGHPLSPVRRRDGRRPIPDLNRTEPRPAF